MGQTRGRGDLSDEQWRLIASLLPKQTRGGRWNDHRTTFDGMLWVLRTGAPWRDLPERYGKWGSVYHRFTRWRKDGTFDRVLKALRIRLDKAGRIDWEPSKPARSLTSSRPRDWMKRGSTSFRTTS